MKQTAMVIRKLRNCLETK